MSRLDSTVWSVFERTVRRAGRWQRQSRPCRRSRRRPVRLMWFCVRRGFASARQR
ncbi:hypothetical protein NM518_2194 [Neisseria meningitidis NM518]|nr:hypothetical protein NM518_2194 [Neisseria meningitidis NM518]